MVQQRNGYIHWLLSAPILAVNLVVVDNFKSESRLDVRTFPRSLLVQVLSFDKLK